jgi:hypothetical protein
LKERLFGRVGTGNFVGGTTERWSFGEKFVTVIVVKTSTAGAFA